MRSERSHGIIAVTGQMETPAGIASHHKLLRGFDSYGFTPNLHRVGWNEGGRLTDKIVNLSDRVEQAFDQFDYVSLLGLSSGGTLALVTFMEHPELTGVVTVGSRLRREPYAGTLEERPFVLEMTDWLSENHSYITPPMRERVMTMHVRSGDERVHPRASELDGARNVEVLFDAKDHTRAVRHIMTREKREIGMFLRDKAT